jgi:transcriptional regulator
MYIPGTFAVTDAARITEFVDSHPLAILVGQVDGRLQANHLPFIRASDLAVGEYLVAHTARANPVWRLGEAGASVLLVFSGADAYVSPSFYPSKATDPRTVPTYNYVGVHVAGTLSCSHDQGEKREAVAMLTRRMEAGRPDPWAIDDAPGEYIDRMLDGIVALRLRIESIEAKWKASQNRTDVDRRGVIDALRAAVHDSPALEAAQAAEHGLGPRNR